MKTFICLKCEANKLSKWFKGKKVFKGTRRSVRKHLMEEHFIKQVRTPHGVAQKVPSDVTANMRSEQYNG